MPFIVTIEFQPPTKEDLVSERIPEDFRQSLLREQPYRVVRNGWKWSVEGKIDNHILRCMQAIDDTLGVTQRRKRL